MKQNNLPLKVSLTDLDPELIRSYKAMRRTGFNRHDSNMIVLGMAMFFLNSDVHKKPTIVIKNFSLWEKKNEEV